MDYDVQIRPAAWRQLKRLPKALQRRILDRLELLAKNPRPVGSAKLTGSECTYRIRIGDYRVIYDVLDRAVVVLVLKIAHRRDVYRRR
ncbi:MAG: type II toxin-antitoxin system RelE/ParE family toxin [Phycisphaerae bacterium]|nr:type II toxin-antitoxin system RelE/ParE family toxin [Phycisphaerae bacterium]